MDEHRLAELFRDAVREAPPASFNETDVRSASRRVTARRRTQLALGSTLVVVLGIGGVVVGTGLLARPDSGTTTAATGEATLLEVPANPPEDGSYQQKSFPSDGPTQGGSSQGSVGADDADNTAPQGCGMVDRKLRDALAAELSVPADQAVTVDIGCPGDSRAAAFVIDGEKISAIVTQRGASMQFPPNTKMTQMPTVGGLTVHVFAQPADGETADRVQAVAAGLLSRF